MYLHVGPILNSNWSLSTFEANKANKQMSIWNHCKEGNKSVKTACMALCSSTFYYQHLLFDHSNVIGQYVFILQFNRQSAFLQHKVAPAYLPQALLQLFVDIEFTGHSMQFEQKFGELLNPLDPNIIMHILPTVLHTFSNRLTWRICFTIKSCFSWWSSPLFSWLLCLIQGWYCKEKLDASHS